MNKRHNYALYRNLSLTTLVAVYLLILVGGIVRSTGSGMGCPDWPKCFGSWVPPTDVSQLPSNYKDVYAQKRKQKNERIAGYIGRLGWVNLADRMLNDPAMYVEETFNPVKTWIEYLNRLLGAVIGLLILATAISSLRYWRTDTYLVLFSVAALLLVLVQAWIGSIVVSTNLLPGTITVHMLLAVVIVGLLLYPFLRTYTYTNEPNTSVWQVPQLKWVLWLSIVAMVAQLIMGTQVREELDLLMASLGPQWRSTWESAIGAVFFVHRSFSWIVLLTVAWLCYQTFRPSQKAHLVLKYLSSGLLLAVLLSIVSGVGMSYFGVPPFLQPLHLVLSVIILGIQFSMLLLVSNVQLLPQATPKLEKNLV
ncbi:COX15/CtaA family protein [Eisenibacter elegans]|uniref:COX15/CtaA family protein n=1 Tax=Eisenibacter elegans TaxID=997 RepID=UPI0005501427|nr:COX15/CtaA family protein [Eisenibacter elegans]